MVNFQWVLRIFNCRSDQCFLHGASDASSERRGTGWSGVDDLASIPRSGEGTPGRTSGRPATGWGMQERGPRPDTHLGPALAPEGVPP